MRHWFPFVCLPALIACSGSTEPGQGELVNLPDENHFWIRFQSDLRPGVDSFDLTETYIDTLVFNSFSEEDDQLRSWFLTDDDKSISMACEEVIDTYGKGSVFRVEWKIDSIGKPDQNDQQRYGEKLLSYEVLKSVKSFSQWLNDGFIDDLKKNDRSQLRKYLHPSQLDFYLAYNPGAFCFVGGDHMPYFNSDFGEEYRVEEGLPEGDFCEGYPNITDGFYFLEIDKNELPKYFDMAGDFDNNSGDYTPELPANGAVDRIVKVEWIVDEFLYSRMYFVQISGQYYLWLEDYCDCSA